MMDPRLRHRMLSQRRFRRVLLLSCLTVTGLLASYYKTCVFDALSSIGLSPAEAFVTIRETITVTVKAQAAATQEASVEQERPLEPHSFRSDGLLEVNSYGRHPIYDLIKRAEDEWENKVKRQSKTLDEAVEEYQHRYRRAPPKGFDDWWFYCERHNVQLPDEYDQIYHDLEPFWGFDPVDLRKVQSERESYHDTFTIGKTIDSKIGLVATALPEDGPGLPSRSHLRRAQEIIQMLQDVSDFIPPFRAVFTPHDVPNVLTNWEFKKRALEAAAAKTYIDVDKAPAIKNLGWPSACSPTSPLRRTTFDLNNPPPPPSKKTFIYNHAKAMDPCMHPSLLHHHGQFLSHDRGPAPQKLMIPQFAFCTTTLHHDILPATPLSWVDDIPRLTDPEFKDKNDERLLWRGTTTGMLHMEEKRWRSQHRTRLVWWAHELNGTESVLRSPGSDAERVGEGKEMLKARLNPAMLDVAFVGVPHSCRGAVCDMLGTQFTFRPRQNYKESGTYKYILDVDGNGWSSRFKQLMVSNSLIFKSTIYPEWFQERIQPWVHYIPVQVDLSDLYDSLTFFRGDLNGDGAHEELAAKIALAGRDWSMKFWRREDLTAYMFRLFLEYARVMSLDREALSYRE